MSVFLWGSHVMVGRSQVGTMPSNSPVFKNQEEMALWIKGEYGAARGLRIEEKVLKQPGIYRL